MLKSSAGNFLFVRSRTTDVPRGTVVFVHGLFDHSGRYVDLFDALHARRFNVFACDAQGHGQSDGPRNLWRDEAAVDDVATLARAAVDRAPPGVPWLLIGKGVGALLAERLAGHCARGDGPAVGLPPLAGLVLLSPAARVDSVYSSMRRGLTSLVGWLAPSLPVGWLDPDAISDVPTEVDSYKQDELVSHVPITASMTTCLLDLMVATARDDLPAVNCPLLVMFGSRDDLVDPAGGVMSYDLAAGARNKAMIAYLGGPHDLLHSTMREAVTDDLCAWVLAVAANAKRRDGLTASTEAADAAEPDVIIDRGRGPGREVTCRLPAHFARANRRFLSRLRSATGANAPEKSASLSGWLIKLGGFVKNWKRRWFVLDSNGLAYYVDPDAAKAQRQVRPVSAMALAADDASLPRDTPTAFVFEVTCEDRTLLCAAEDEASRDAWLKAINEE